MRTINDSSARSTKNEMIIRVTDVIKEVEENDLSI